MGLSATNPQLPTEVVPVSPLPNSDFSTQPWHAAYMAALFETDRKQMANRITEARHLILRREQELLSAPPNAAEKNALNRAMYALRALRTCLGL